MATAISGCSAVVHLAALGSVPRSVADPIATHEANARGTLNILQAARAEGDIHVVLASSSSVYGANPTLPKVEDMACLPTSPYAVSKLATEQYAMAFARCYDLPVLPLRFFNVYGPNQMPGHAYAAVIPVFVAAALRGSPLPVHGDGQQSRDFTFVDTVIEVLTHAVLQRVTAGPTNLAFGTRTDLNTVIALVAEALGRSVEVDRLPARPGDVRHSQADNTRLRSLFPEIRPTPLAEGLAAHHRVDAVLPGRSLRCLGMSSPTLLVWGGVVGVGGTESRMAEVVAHWRQEGHRTISVVLAAEGDSPLRRLLEASGSEVVQARAVRRLAAVMRRSAPGLVIAFGLQASLFVRTLRLATRLRGRRWPHTVDARNGLEMTRRRLPALVDRWTQGLVDTFLANSDAAAADLTRRGFAPGRVRVLYSALGDSWQSHAAEPDPEPASVVMVGNARPEKQQWLGLEVFARLPVAATLSVFTNDAADLRDHWNGLAAGRARRGPVPRRALGDPP